MGFAFAVNPRDVQPANEGFLTKIAHAFTKDAKCAALLPGVIEKLKSYDQQKFASLKTDSGIRSFKWADVASKYVDACYQASVPLVNFWEKHKGEQCTDALDTELINIIKKAGKTISGKFDLKKVRELTEQKGTSSTFGEQGYTTQNTSALLKLYSKAVAGNRKLIQDIDSINMMLEWFDVKDMNSDRDCISYSYAIILMSELYLKLDYIGFYLAKKL